MMFNVIISTLTITLAWSIVSAIREFSRKDTTPGERISMYLFSVTFCFICSLILSAIASTIINWMKW